MHNESYQDSIVMTDQDVRNTPEAWENEDLGADERYVAQAPPIDNYDIDTALDLHPISIRLQKSLVDDLKMIAKTNGIGYQPLIRQVLTRFVEAEKKHLLQEKSDEVASQEKDTPENSDPSAKCG